MTIFTGTLYAPTAGNHPTAAQLASFHDALAALNDPWTSYTPSWTSVTGAPAIGNGSIVGQYARLGKFILFVVNITTGTTTTYGTTGGYTVTAPVTAASVRQYVSGFYSSATGPDAGGLIGSIAPSGTNVTPLRAMQNNAALGVGLFAAATAGQTLDLHGMYQAA